MRRRALHWGATLIIILALPLRNAFAQIYQVTDMNTEQLRAIDRNKSVVLLPGGILEEHGPYLPSYSDGYYNERITQELASAIVARPGWSVLIFPMVPLGASGANEIGGRYSFSGTYAVRSSTVRSVFMDLATELGEQGFRWVFIIHGHGAPIHNRALDEAGDYFHDIFGGAMVHLLGLMPSGENTDPIPRLLNEKERHEEGFSVHADLGETSGMLFLRPDLVNPAYKNAPPLTGRDMNHLIQIAKEENWPGYFGSPRLARAALGAQAFKLMSAQINELALKILNGLDYRQISRFGDVTRKNPANAAIDKAALEHEQEVEKKQSEWLRKKGLQ
jgi:creatinine amidohydrolase/Fe(II)-dependent formamide hydrolase-like protein